MSNAGDELDRVWHALSEPRLTPYLETTNSRRDALALYEWSARTASACFEVVGHFEVLLRNALDNCLSTYFRENERGMPWFLLSIPDGEHIAEAVSAVRERLQQEEQSQPRRNQVVRDSRHQVVAGMTFGFWSGLLGPRYEELWRACLHRAFPNSTGRRKDVSTGLERVRRFRNRLAHHDSVINIDVPFEIRQIIELAGYIDTDAARWLERRNGVMTVYAQRPVALAETVVVAARQAWPLYLACHAYVCQAGRTFRTVDRIAFYTDREIKQHLPGILHRRDNVEWTPEEANRLRQSPEALDRRIATVIDHSRSAGWSDGRYQVFLLTRPGDPGHRELVSPLANRGSAFTRGQRYVSLRALETAKTTADV